MMLSLVFSLVFTSFAVQAAPTARSYYQNGVTAQQLNYNFTSMKASDPCTSTYLACIDGGFAQCSDGVWAITPCPDSLTCAALPSVGSETGTTIACTYKADAVARIEDTGVTGGVTGQDTNSTSSAISSSSSTPSSAFTSQKTSIVLTATQKPTTQSPSPSSTLSLTSTTTNVPSAAADPDAVSRGEAAQKQNKYFQSLSLRDYCEPTGLVGCISDILANCNNGYWSLGASCTVPNTKCFAVPAASGNETSIGCYTPEAVSSLISATGASGDMYGAHAKQLSTSGAAPAFTLSFVTLAMLLLSASYGVLLSV